MNKYLQDYLISPETGLPLHIVGDGEEGLKNGQLKGNDSLDIFNIVNGIPILLQHNQIADCIDNITEIIFRGQSNEIYRKILSKTGHNYDLYKKELDKYILNEYGKEGVIKAYEDYSKLSKKEKLRWYATLDKDDKNNSNQIPSATLKHGLVYATPERGRYIMGTTDERVSKWAVHLNDYANLVTKYKSGIIVELSTGSGFGTCAVIKSGLGDIKIASIDIDYACTGNAAGIAKYLEIEDKVDPIVANFWYIPFKTNSVDTVCSHYGLDEAREISRILSEISRILKSGGEFINVSRKDPTLRIKQRFEILNFSEDEYLYLDKLAGLYSGMDDLKNDAKKYNLILDYQKLYSPDGSHERIISVFKKI